MAGARDMKCVPSARRSREHTGSLGLIGGSDTEALPDGSEIRL
jgi:hypothetical protein